MEEIFSIQDKIPEKGVDIIAFDSRGDKHYCFRCNCVYAGCMEWRCSVSGGGLIINVVKWMYDHEQ